MIMQTNEVPTNIPIRYDVAFIAKQTSDAKVALDHARNMVVNDEHTMATANAWAKAILTTLDQLEEMRTSITKPILEGKRGIDNLFKPSTNALDEAQRIIKRKMSDHLSNVQALQQAEFRKAQEAMQQGNTAAMAVALNASSAAQAAPPQGTSVVERWQAEIFNADFLIEACLQDPNWRKFLAPNASMIDAVARSTPVDQTPLAIPGVRFTKVSTVSVRR